MTVPTDPTPFSTEPVPAEPIAISVVDDYEYTPIWDSVATTLDVLLADLDDQIKQAQDIIP